MSEIDLRDPARFDHWTSFPIRFSDQDSMGHVNNVSYAAYIETGRLLYFVDTLKAFPGIENHFVLANLNIDYVREMHFPGEARVGTRTMRVGRSSITTGYGVFKGDICCATATCVNVHINLETRRGKPFPDDLRAAMEAALAAGP